MSIDRIIPFGPAGFDAGEGSISLPHADLDAASRHRLMLSLEAIISGATPEELADFLVDEFPESVTASLDRPWEADELSEHVDVLLALAMAPAVMQAA